MKVVVTSHSVNYTGNIDHFQAVGIYMMDTYVDFQFCLKTLTCIGKAEIKNVN